MKQNSLRFATNLYISQSIQEHVGLPGRVVGNPYDSTAFFRNPTIPKDRDFVFIGRLVSDKGCDLLVSAFSKIDRSPNTTLTIIGSGPEVDSLKRLVARLGLSQNATFTGPLQGTALAKELNRHRIIVVPSLWAEPFGIVALEGMACGCFPVVSSDGGLPEATGPHGHKFKNRDTDGLTAAMQAALNAVNSNPTIADGYNDHLGQFQPQTIASKYLETFEALAQREKSKFLKQFTSSSS